jgi:hypothetical protein
VPIPNKQPNLVIGASRVFARKTQMHRHHLDSTSSDQAPVSSGEVLTAIDDSREFGIIVAWQNPLLLETSHASSPVVQRRFNKGEAIWKAPAGD